MSKKFEKYFELLNNDLYRRFYDEQRFNQVPYE